MAAMFGRGAMLPDGCAFAGGQADGAVIRAAYSCPSGEVVFALGHPSTAAAGSLQTERFAITLERGAPPDGLVAALLWLVRSREASFEWTSLAEEEAGGTRNDAAAGE